MFHGEIRGFSNPALKQFTHSFWYLGLLVVQCTHLIAILIKSAWLKVDKLEIKLFLSTLSVWPIFLLLSATNHVKASLYMPRYFIPVAAVAMALSISFLVQYHFRLNFVFLKHLKNWIGTKFIKLLIFALVGGLLATNYLIVREQLSVIPVAEPYQSAVKSALKDLKNPKFVVGDYWYSYPMKLFINNSDKFPVVSNFYMEDQKIFQKENRNRLLDSFAESSRGICFGSFAECQIQFNKLASVLMDKYFLNFKLKEVSVNYNKPMPISIVEIDSLSESKSKCWNGAQLNSVVGRISKNEIVGDPEKSGFLTFGPYIGVVAGEYMYTLTYISNGPTTEIGSYDMVLGTSTFGPFKPVLGSNNVEVQLKTTFRVDEGVSPRDDLIEFRFITNGSQLVTVKSLCITKIR